MLSKISLIIASSFLLSSCAYTPWIKENVPDEPICRHLDERVTKKIIAGKEYTLRRENPRCMKAIGEGRCGYCVWTVSDKEQYVGEEWNHLLQVGKKKKKWSTIQAEAMTVPAETQAASKAFAINICKITNACADQIDRWRIKLDALDSIGTVVNKP